MSVDQRNALDRVNAEWAQTRRSPQAETQVRQWSRGWPALAGCESPADVLSACYRFDDSSDAALLTLLRIMHGPDAGRHLAARLVLHSLLGRAVREFLPRLRGAFDDPADAASALLAAVVEAVATYPPGQRREGVKRRLLTRTGTIFRREARAFDRMDRRTQAVRGRREIPCDPVALGTVLDGIAETTTDPIVEAAEALAAAVRRRVISRDDARLVARRHLAGRPVPFAELAVELGITEAAVRQRCSRIVRRVAAAGVAA